MYATMLQAMQLQPLLWSTWVDQMARDTRQGLVAFQRLYPPAPEYRSNELRLSLDPNRLRLLVRLMGTIQETSTPNLYGGAVMDETRTRNTAQMSEDWNDVHMNPLRAHPITAPKCMAHGWDAVMQGYSAVRFMRGKHLVVKRAEIAFRNPVILGRKRLWISTPPAPNGEMIQEVLISHGTTPDRAIPVVSMTLELEESPHSENDWYRTALATWGASPAIAKTARGSLYSKKSLTIHRPPIGDSIVVQYRGQGLDHKGRYIIGIKIYDAGSGPCATGTATAFPA